MVGPAVLEVLARLPALSRLLDNTGITRQFIALSRGAIIGHITAEMAIPKTWSKKKQRAALCGEIWPAKRPDLSNICKQVEDALIGVVFRDDALIVRYDTMQKRYSAQPKIVATYQPVRS